MTASTVDGLSNEERIALARRVIDLVYQGRDVIEALAETGMHRAAYYRLLAANTDLREEHVQARHSSADWLVAQAKHIADTEIDAQRARNMIDIRKWTAAKIAPQTYGDRIELNVTQTVDMAGALAESRKRVLNIPSQVIDIITDSTQRATECQSVAQLPDKSDEKISDDIFN